MQDGGACLPADRQPPRCRTATSGLLCTIEFVARNGGTWTNPSDDPEGDETVAIIEGVAARAVNEDELTAWIAERLK